LFLKGAGVVTVVVAGGAVWRAYDQGVFSVGEGPAYKPWKDWRNTANDGPLALVSAAILAASPHNTQPWLFKITNSSIELHIDMQRNVGALDPYLREEHIGMGCALNGSNVTAGTFAGGAGAVLAAKTPLGRLGRVSDIAPLAVFLASDESAWITGEVIRAAGGLVVAT